MAISKKTNEAKENKCTVCVTDITNVHDWGNGSITFDMTANDIKIYGMRYVEYTNKKGEEGSLISFPSKKGNDGKYYNHVWFAIDKQMKDAIVETLSSMV